MISLVADSGLALFAGLNAIPQKSFLSEYSHRLERRHTLRLLGARQEKLSGSGIVTGESINPDFHSLPYAGEHPAVEKHFVAMRSRRQPSILAFLASGLLEEPPTVPWWNGARLILHAAHVS